MTTEKNPNELLLEWSRAGFVGLNRDQLKQAAEALGVDFAPQTNNETLANKLRAAIGMVDSTLSASEIAEVAPPSRAKLSLNATPPNLSASGRWGGRYRRVRLVRTEALKDFNAFPLSWEGQQKYFHFDTELDMAWPYFEALRNMRETTITQTLSADGKHSERREVTNQAVPYSDMGDTPGTEALPTSMREYVYRLAQDNGFFKSASRRDLIRIARLLHGPAASVTAKDQTDDEVRDGILTFIGVDIYEEAA